MRLSKKDIIKYITILILILSIFLPIKLIRESLAETEAFTLSAVLYDTNMYAGGSGTTLTTSGATVSSWKYGTSKYLQINPQIKANGKRHFLKVILPKELYAVTSDLKTPAGFADVKFKKNSALPVNDRTVSYALKTYSGTFEYTMDIGFETGNIQMEVQWDDYLWDKRANVSITPSGVKPISVVLYEEEDNGNLKELKELSISRVTSGEALTNSATHTYIMDQISYNSLSLEAAYNKEVSSSITLLNQSYSNYYFYYPTAQITVQLPSYTYNGKKYYLTVNDTTPAFSRFYGNKIKYTVDTSKMSSQGIIVYNFTDFYWEIGGTMMRISLKFPDELKSVSNVKSFAFTGGSYVGKATSNNGDSNISFFNIGMPTLTYRTDIEEKVTFRGSGSSTTLIERPNNAVSRLGGFFLENSGTGDSCAKTITINFDTGNTNRVKVTTIQTFADQVSQTIPIEYTLVDENGQRVYLNASGEKVSAGTSGAIDTWTYNMKNAYYNSKEYSNIRNIFTRSMLPESQRNYYFKSVKYTIGSIKSKARLYAYQGEAALSGVGNFLGYVNTTATNGQTATHSATVTSAVTSYSTLTASCNTTLQNTSAPSFGINSASLNKSSIMAGENIEINGKFSVSDYPYGNSGWIKGIRLGVTLPKGVSINNDSVSFTSATGQKITPKQITSKNLNNGNFLWTIILPDDICIGYARENATVLETGDNISFKFQVDTENTMNEVTIFARDALQVAGLYQTNTASGSWQWARSTDINDLNENGQTTDAVGGVAATNTSSCSISSQNATINIKDKVTVTSGGVTGQETDKIALKTPEDVITYTIEFENESAGKAENFSYYIPIPKSSSGKDSFIQNQTKNGGFDLSMTEIPKFEGDDLFNISYTFKTGLTYSAAQQQASEWYTKEQIEADPSMKWENVTMIKFTGKNKQISNGEQLKMTYKLKYSGSAFAEEAGMSNEWNGAGYYQYTNGDRVSSGNYATNTITASLEYSIEGEDITLTAARNRSPIIPEDVNEITLDKTKFPKFKNSQTFQIQSIDNYNVTMQTKQYVQENVDMRSIYANATFAVTVALDGKAESDIVQKSLNKEVGSSQAGQEPQFTFRLYNGDRLTDSSTSRYIVVTFKSDNGVTFKQKIIINREISSAVNIQNSIVSGKTYISFDDKDSSTTISGDSAFTAQIVAEYIPSFFKGQEILFSDNMPVGTTMILAKINDQENPLYYYYRFTEAKNAVDFDELISMGTTDTHNYEYADKKTETITDKFLAIVDFSQVEGGQIAPGSYTIKVHMKGDGEDDYFSEELTVITTQRRAFSFSINENIPVKTQSIVNYVIGDESSAESKYTGKKVALVIQAPEEMPLDTNILVESSTKYYMNSNRQFIIPLGDIEQTNGNLRIMMQSDKFPTKGAEYKCTATLWVSATSNGTNPMLGEKIEEKNVTFTAPKQLEPALKVKGMNRRIIKSNEINENMTLDFEYKPDTDCYVTIELNQKEGNFYRKVTTLLTQVNGSTNHNMGAYTINAVQGQNTVTMRVANSIPIGTYRLILRVYSKNGEELLQVPYNFIITQAKE